MPRIKLSHRIEYGLYRAFETALRLLSVETTVSLGEFLGRIAMRLLPKYHRIVERNLRFAFSDSKSPAELDDLLHEVFERNGGNLISAIRLPFLKDDQLRKHVTFENTELLDQVHAQKKGILTIIPHMGNWELLAQALPMLKPDALGGAFYRKLNNPLMDQLIEKRRKKRGIELFAKHASSHKLTSFLRRNGGLGILGDQRMPKRGHPVIFFGRPTTFSPLPELLAKRTDASLLGMHCRSSGPAQWTITFTEIKDPTPQSCAENLEKAWRSSPADVFWFQDRWRLSGPSPLAFLEKMPSSPPVTKPLRIASTAAITLPEHLARVEVITLDLTQPTETIATQLRHLNDSENTPIDLYLCDEKELPLLEKATDRIRIITHQSLPN